MKIENQNTFCFGTGKRHVFIKTVTYGCRFTPSLFVLMS